MRFLSSDGRIDLFLSRSSLRILASRSFVYSPVLPSLVRLTSRRESFLRASTISLMLVKSRIVLVASLNIYASVISEIFCSVSDLRKFSNRLVV